MLECNVLAMSQIPSTLKHSGTLYYPGRGRYEATWDHGKVVEGRLFFEDGLEHQKENWIYCSPEDRRYYCEVTDGLRPAGDSYITPTRREGQM